MTTVFCCATECGVFGADARHWHINLGTPTFDTSVFRGRQSIRFSAASGNVQVGSATLTSGPILVGRFYARWDTLPSHDCRIFHPGGVFGTIVFRVSDSSLYCANGSGSPFTFGATGYRITTGRFYRIDFLYNATNGTIDGKVNGQSLGQITGLAATDASDLEIGMDTGSETLTAGVMYCTDIVASQTSADYPIGAGIGVGFVPNRDGLHTSTGTNINVGNAAAPTGGAAVTSATFDAYSYVDARPMGGGKSDSTRLLNQNAVAAAEYVEIGFERPIDELPAPQAVDVVVIDQQATTAAGGMSIKLNDNGTEDTILVRSAAAGSVTDRYTRKHYATMPGGGGVWTKPRFNDVRVRFGYSDDATPDQYFRGVMIEADFPEVNPRIYRRLPPTQRMASDA